MMQGIINLIKRVLLFFGFGKKEIATMGLRFYSIKNTFFSITGLQQMINIKSVPIIIISFNQLYYLQRLVIFLKKHHYSTIVIIDNNSTYKPLLDYFDSIQSTVTVHRLQENLGHMVFWKHQALFEMYSKGYYVVTDPDIVPDADCPADFLKHFKKILNKNLKLTKVGFSLKIDDIPDTNLNKQKVIDWESKFWDKKTIDGNYIAPLDTTFALYKQKYKYNGTDFYNAIRTAKPYQAAHGGWYINLNNFTEEQNFYFETCNESSSWRVNKQGELKDKMYLN